MTTPYRSAGPLESRVVDPARARLGLAIAAAGALVMFGSLLYTSFGPVSPTNGAVLSTSAAVIAVGIGYSALDAPRGRALLLASATVFAATFLALRVHGVRPLVWPTRYAAVAGIAGGLLLRLHRSKPGTYGVLLRLAGIIGAWWGLQWIAAAVLSDATRSWHAEALSRVCYLLLAAGMLDVRRYLGTAPQKAPVRTPIDAAREIASTRLCLGATSLGIALVWQQYTWHSTWSVLFAFELVAIVLSLAAHVPWLARTRALRSAIAAAALMTIATLLALDAADVRGHAAYAMTLFVTASITVDVAVTRFALRSDEPSMHQARFMTMAAITLRVTSLLIVLTKLASP